VKYDPGRDFTCGRCGKNGSARWLDSHGHHRWSAFLLPWLGDFSGLLNPRVHLAGKRLWDDYAPKHRRGNGG
jgi:hypothetical protein